MKKKFRFLKNSRSSWNWPPEPWLTTRIVGLALLFSVVVIILVGKFETRDLVTNFISELVGIIFTVLIIDWISEYRETHREKKQLRLQLGSPDKGFSVEALRILRERGWLYDETLWAADLSNTNFEKADLSHVYLESVFFKQANLKESILWGAKLKGAHLDYVDLREAKVSDKELAIAGTLRGATMPDGKKYNGRLRLMWDVIEIGHTAPSEAWNADGRSTNELFDKFASDYYGVSIEDYLEGQIWADKNLQNLRKDFETPL